MLNNGGLGFAASDLAKAFAPAKELHDSMSWARDLREQLYPKELRQMRDMARAAKEAFALPPEITSTAKQLADGYAEMRRAIATPMDKFLGGSLAATVALTLFHEMLKVANPTTLATDTMFGRFANESGLGVIAAHLAEVREGISPMARVIERWREAAYNEPVTASPVYEPIMRRELAPILSPRPAPAPPPPITISLDPRCLLCGEPVACADIEVTSVEEYKVRGQLDVMPCVSCIRRILENENYFEERLREIKRSRFTLLNGGGQGDGVPKGFGPKTPRDVGPRRDPE